MSGKRSGIYPFLYEGYEFTFLKISCDNCELERIHATMYTLLKYRFFIGQQN